MKIRTKLILLLLSALVITMAVSTWARIHFTRNRLQEQLKQAAQDNATAIADELGKRLRFDMDEDEIKEILSDVERRHPGAGKLELTLFPDENTATTFSVSPAMEEAEVRKHARPGGQKERSPAQRREDARRAFYDHGESLRAPMWRMVEPMWRTPDKQTGGERWQRGPKAAAAKRRTVTLSVQSTGGRTLVDAEKALELEGPLAGTLQVTMSDEPILATVRDEKLSSALITGSAVLLLMIVTALIVDHVVGRPVGVLEQAMAQIEGGSLEARVPIGGQDELGRLSHGFNAMLERLWQADQEIRAFNRRLADEVKAATLDLARKNEALAQLNRLLRETRQELGDKERLAALGQLAAQLAHEIGTPLGSVSGHLQLALVGGEVPPPLRDRIDVATRELDRVIKIVRDYLDSTRTVAPERVHVDLERVIDEALGVSLSGEARQRVEVKKRIAADAAGADTDPGLLRQILINLVTNAVDAVADGGQVSVETRREEGGAAVAVRDDGAGIAPEDLVRIFEPFYTTKGRGKGTGLGLAICRELATALGGRITVESTPGRGSVFTIHLPRGERKVA